MRWGATAESIEAATRLLVGDVFLAAGCIAYLGAFTGAFRWAGVVRLRQVSFYVFSSTCCDDITLLEPCLAAALAA